MANRNQPFTLYNYMRMPDGSELLMSKVENRGAPNEKITRYITEEQREEFSQRMMSNVSKVMSDYYAQKEIRKLSE